MTIIILMNNIKTKGFFQHPVFVRRIPRKSQHTSLSFTSANGSIDRSQIEQDLRLIKNNQIQKKKQRLLKLQQINHQLQQQSAEFISKQQQTFDKLKKYQFELIKKIQHLQIETKNCKEVEKVEAEEFLEWQNRECERRHKQSLEQTTKKYQEITEKKLYQIQEVQSKLKNAQDEIEILRRRVQQQSKIERLTFQAKQIPTLNLRLKNNELQNIREKVKLLKQNKRLLTTQIKQQLDPTKWRVKQTFENSKQKINREMRRLLTYLENPDKQFVRNITNNDKIPNPVTLIQNYQQRLEQLVQMIPNELKTQSVLKCLKPLPWRTIKGVSIQAKASTVKSYQRFHRLQKQYSEIDTKNLEYKAELQKKEAELNEKYGRKLFQLDSKIKQLK